MYYGGFSYTEAYNIPVAYKKWFIDRTRKEIQGPEKDSNNPGQGNSRAHHHNPSDVASLMGKTRPESPARLRRFS